MALSNFSVNLGMLSAGSTYNARRLILPVTSISHGQSGRTGTILGLNNLITTELDTVDEAVVLVVRNGDAGLGLAEKGNNGLAGVATDDRNDKLLRVGFASNLGNEGLSSDDVKGGNTEHTLRVEDTLGLQDLDRNGDGGVDWVGDDENEGVGSDLSSDLNEALDDAGIDVEEIVTGHTRPAYCQQSVSEC